MARRKHPVRKARVAPRAAAATAAVAPNYQYWREHGGEWSHEYERRKKRNVAYHIQEIMLADYFAHSAPARVLEYGCGPGRHLRYLNDLPGIEVHGYDQSAAMAQGVRRWASKEWFGERVTIGEPTGRLPYPDRSFDVVFTAEVLVHVRPEDLEGILAELARVASWQVLHLETSHDCELHQVAHEGCWKHDLVAAYGRLGLTCELLPRGYPMHTPQRVVRNRKRRLYTWPTGPIALLARMESEIGRGWLETTEQCERERKRAEGAEARHQSLGDRVAELIRQLDEAKQRVRQAEVKSESHLSRLQTASETLEKQTAGDRERAAADAAARQKEEDRARHAEARCETYLGRIESLRDALEKQIAASQERAGQDGRVLRGLEDRAAALQRQCEAAAQRVATAQEEIQKACQQAQEQTQKALQRASEAEARCETVTGHLGAAQQGLERQKAAMQERAAKDAELRQRLEERVSALQRQCEAGVQRVAAIQEELQKARRDAQEQIGKERQRASQAEERVSALQRQCEAGAQRAAAIQEEIQKARRDAQEQIGKERQRASQAEERVSALQRQCEAGAQRVAAIQEELQKARRDAQEQIGKERQRASDAEARGEVYLARVDDARRALEQQSVAAKERAAADAEARQRLEQRIVELQRQGDASAQRLTGAETRAAHLEERLEHERRRARDAEARGELYLARITEVKEALGRQTTSAKELAAQLVASRRELEQRAAAFERRRADLEREYTTALAEAESRFEEENKSLADEKLHLQERLRATEERVGAETVRAQDLDRLLADARGELQRFARERAAQRREEDAKRRRLTEQARALEARHGSFLAGLHERLLGPEAAASGMSVEPQERLLLERAEQAAFELRFIKQRFAYRALRRLRRSLPYRIARWLPRRNRDVVTVRALGTKGPTSGDSEVWLLGARCDRDQPPIPWDFMAAGRAAWFRRPDPSGPYGEFLVSKRGRLRFALHGERPVLTFLKHPWSGKVEVRYAGRREVFDLYSPHTDTLEVHPAQQPMGVPASSEPDPSLAPASALAERPVPQVVAAQRSPLAFSAEDERWLASIHRASPSVLALHVPRWLGVSSSTRILFDHRLAFPRTAAQEPYRLGVEEVRYNAELILASGVRHVVASGGDEIQFQVFRELKKLDPQIRCDLLWHASYVQMSEDYNWAVLRMWVEGARAGIVETIGTVKQGMERFFERCGIRSRFVMNYVPEIPNEPSVPREGGPHLGIWISGNSYRKLPYAMLAAVKMIPGAVLNGSNFVKRVRDAIDLFEIPVHRISDKPLPQDQMLQAIRDTHLTLYVTFSECSPMLPLESLSVGTPCLVGPTSHLFEDDDFLRSRLVVPAPDRADVIAEWIGGALAERDAIVRAYMRWAPAYNERARKSVEEFLRG